MEKVSKEVAGKEIEAWLDYKKVSESKREASAESIATLVNAICDGALSKQDDNTLVHELKFPLENEMSLTKLEYKPRLAMSAIHTQLQGVKPSDADGRLIAYVAALTGKAKGIIKGLDTEDYAIGQAVAIFFL